MHQKVPISTHLIAASLLQMPKPSDKDHVTRKPNSLILLVWGLQPLEIKYHRALIRSGAFSLAYLRPESRNMAVFDDGLTSVTDTQGMDSVHTLCVCHTC